MALFVFWTVRS